MEDTKKNAYTILELQPGPDVDDTIIKKAYRRLAILKHPDKNRDNPNAAEEFAELEQAYRLLLDKDARGALDDLLRAQAQRAARESQVSDKRRKLKEELERRERQ
ncbi:molecular chaperone, partial [Volvox carteri f. nagariensis]